jgi:hypothetical protein
MKAVIYARYSSENQREESIEGQLRECTAFAKSQGITILNTYIDRAMTAKSDNRPEFQKMITDASKELFDLVIVWKLDRFARNRYDSAHYKGILRKHGIKVIPPSSITKVLRNRKYIGEYGFKDVVQSGVIPEIVPRDLFDAVQERLDKNMHAPARFKAKEERYLLSTKLFCGACDTFMVGESGAGKGGKTFRYYKCANAKRRKGCKRKAIRKAGMEGFAIEYIRRFLMDDALLKALAKKLYAIQKQDNSELPIMKKELAETEKAAGNMLNAIQQGVFNELTKNRLDELQERKTDLEVRIANAEILRDVLTEGQILFWLLHFRKYDLTNEEQRQRLVDTFINAIYVYDDKVVFTFNYRDGTETVTLAELGCSDLDYYAVPQ